MFKLFKCFFHLIGIDEGLIKTIVKHLWFDCKHLAGSLCTLECRHCIDTGLIIILVQKLFDKNSPVIGQFPLEWTQAVIWLVFWSGQETLWFSHWRSRLLSTATREFRRQPSCMLITECFGQDFTYSRHELWSSFSLRCRREAMTEVEILQRRDMALGEVRNVDKMLP